MNEFSKNPDETYPIGVDYTGKAPSGASLISGLWSAWDITTDVDATSDVIDDSAGVVSGSIVKVRVEAGSLGHVYRLGVTATFNTGDVLHDSVYMSIRQDA